MKALDLRRFLSFCLVGTVGFLVDAGVLLSVQHAGAGPLWGRAISAPAAMVATFLLNRHIVFRDDRGALLATLAAYLATQGIGFLCNLAIYALALMTLPRPMNLPIACLAIASAAALVVNYVGARYVAFTNWRAD